MNLDYQQTKQKLWWNICREADESRLREVCESFLGPPTGMAEEASSDKSLAWDPVVLVRLFFNPYA